MSTIFTIITFCLKAFGLWDQFLDHVDAMRTAAAEVKAQNRGAAIEKLEKATSEEEFDKAQSDLINNKP